MPTLVKHVSVLLMIVRGGISVLNGAPETVISMPHHFGKLRKEPAHYFEKLITLYGFCQ